MARRATYFFDVHKSDSPRLLVSGGWEYMRPDSIPPSADVLEAFSKSYSYIKYDVGLLTEQEYDVFSNDGVTPDTNRMTAEAAPFVVVTTDKDDLVGFIRLPSLSPGELLPSDAMLNKAASAVRTHRKEVKLLIALSDWGRQGEKKFLDEFPDDTPDMLFGSGPGGAVNGNISANGRCLWVRPYDKGRTVSEVQVLAWPERTKSFVWKEPGNIKSLTTGLGDQYQDNPDVSKILY